MATCSTTFAITASTIDIVRTGRGLRSGGRASAADGWWGGFGVWLLLEHEIFDWEMSILMSLPIVVCAREALYVVEKREFP